MFLCYYTPRERSSEGYIGITLSVCSSVCADLCQAHNFFLFLHWLAIFCTWVYHHEMMCRVHSCSRYDLELWPQSQIYRVFDMFLCLAVNCFLIWHLLTIFGTWVYHLMRSCDTYIHVPDSLLSFDLKVKFIGFCHVFMSNL